MKSALLPTIAVLLCGGLPAQVLTEGEKAKVEASIIQTVEDAKNDVAAAHNELIEQFDKAVQSLKDGDSAIDELERQRSAFVANHDLPKHRLMRKARKAYSEALKDAESNRDEKLDSVSKGLRKRDLPFWRTVQERVAQIKKDDLNRELISALSPWVSGSQWVNDNAKGRNKTKGRVWTVRSLNEKRLTLEKPSIGKGVVVFELMVDSTGAVSVINASHTNSAMESRAHKGSGIIRADSLKFTFEAQIRKKGENWRAWGPQSIVLRPMEGK